MAAQLVKALGASLTTIKQSNMTVNNAIQVRLVLACTAQPSHLSS